MNFKAPLWWVKLTRFEFWPYWIFYIPTVPYFIYLGLKSGKITFFTNVNPGIYLSGIIGESKQEILKHIPDQYKPTTVFITKSDVTEDFVMEKMRENGLNFPVIFKPDVGERGASVEKIKDQKSLSDYINRNKENLLIQEFVDYGLEFGVMFYKIPDSNEYAVTSIVQKGFLKVRGDGISSLKTLLEKDLRALLVMDFLEEQLSDTWNEIIPEGKIIYPQPIGNHCKGTMFINANDLISTQISDLFVKIADSVPEFYYGRFDIKVKSIDDLHSGNNLKVMELNGLTSEPGHIYDPKMSLIQAYKDVMYHMKLTYRISKVNKQRGFKPSEWNEFYNLMKEHK